MSKTLYQCLFCSFKDVGRCKELLLGGGSAHIGLFIERKQNNFFNVRYLDANSHALLF